MKWCGLVLQLLMLSLASPKPPTVQYVTPNSSCPDQCNCTTLQQCIESQVHYNKSVCFSSDTKLILLEGIHTISTQEDSKITLHYLQNFTMLGSGRVSPDSNTPPEPSTTIVCNNSIGLQFRFSEELEFTNLAFERCGAPVAVNITYVHAALAFFVVTDLKLESLAIKHSKGFGLHAEKVYGEVIISHSIFARNKGGPKYYGGNAHIWYIKCSNKNSSASVTIQDSWFEGGDSEPVTFCKNSNATGLEILVSCPNIRVKIRNITARNNTAIKGGNLAIAVVDRHNGSSKVSLENSHIHNGSAERGGGLTVWSEIDRASQNATSCGGEHDSRVVLEIVNTNFSSNYATKDGGGLYLGHYERGKVDCIVRQIKFVNCTFFNNSVEWRGSGAGVLITKYKAEGYIPHPEPQFEVGFHNCTFNENSFKIESHPTPDIHLHGIINAQSVGKLVVNGSRFIDNKSTAISLQSSNLLLEGEVLFQNNTAYNGGALELCTSSLIFIKNSIRTNVTFIGNRAHNTGGAIYAQEPCLDTVPACFFQPTHITNARDECDKLNFSMSLTFINNTAGQAGDAIFNGAIDYCYLVFNHHLRDSPTSNRTLATCVFNKIFDTHQQEWLNETSTISSEPHRICLCEDHQKENCSLIDYTYPDTVFPGEKLNLSVIAVGQRDGIVPAVVEAYLVENNNNTDTMMEEYVDRPGEILIVNKTQKTCTPLTVAIASNETTVFFNLTVQNQRWKYSEYPRVRVNLGGCPYGFKPGSSKTCECESSPQIKWKLSCNADRFKYQRLEPIWVGCTKTGCQFAKCTYDYCNLSILNQDYDLALGEKQCAFNRNGTMCGACKGNYSVMLGSSKCEQCSNSLLAPLLVVFVIAGIAMFVFLFTFNFTVTEGTINGLILYANIAHQKSNLFLPKQRNTPFQILIAWFNLDLGIETCFFNGLDDYTKLWLQYAFIAYLWIIGGLIIISSNKYIIVTRLLGRNATKVIATIFLLSFAKVVSISLKIVTFTFIQDAQRNISTLACGFDGNIAFLQQKHVPLFVFAWILLVIFAFFTVALTFIQFLQKISNVRMLRWVEKFRPFFEAFTGPCRDNYRFWPGLLFMCRAALLCVDIIYHNPQESLLWVVVVTAISMFLLCFACVTPKGVYKKWQLNILESSFILNLLVASIALLVNESISKYSIPFIHFSWGHKFTVIMYCSVSVAVLIFIGILLFHTYTQLKSSRLTKACIKFVRKRRQKSPKKEVAPPAQSVAAGSTDRPTTSIVTLDDSVGDSLESSAGEATPLLTQSMPPVANYNYYREPLLADDD